MKNLNKLQNEITQEFKKFNKVPASRKALIKRYMTGQAPSDLEYLGLSVPLVRSLLKKDLSVFHEDFKTQFAVFEKNWFESKTFDQKSLSLYWLESLTAEQLLEIAKALLNWATEVDNWAHSDCLCSTYAKIFELAPQVYLPVYKKWNKHSSSWHRRISLVGLFYYSRIRKKHPSFKLAHEFIKPHFHAEEYYVQKAVGWTLREMYNVYPKETLILIDKNIAIISPIAWVAASEKLKLDVKNALLKKRRAKRIKN